MAELVFGLGEEEKEKSNYYMTKKKEKKKKKKRKEKALINKHKSVHTGKEIAIGSPI